MSYEPFKLFLKEISKSKELLPDTWNNMALATVDDTGAPFVRYVLLKEYSENGLVFFTNYSSKKAKHISNNSKVALLFYWPTRGVQIRVRGNVAKVASNISDNYFRQRDRGSKIGAWASRQSSEMDRDDDLEANISLIQDKFSDMDVPRPDFWGGYSVTPISYEFWYQGEHRLHKRELFTLVENGSWDKSILYP